MKNESQQYYNTGDHCSVQMIQVENHVKIRVTSYLTSNESGNNAIVFVGGLSTAMESFRHIISELKKDFPLHYIETRDHSSSQIDGEALFDIQTSGLDIVRVIELLGLENDKYTLIGYSLGATVITDGYRFLKSKPRQMIFVEPTPVFHYPKWSLNLMKVSIGLKSKPLKPFAKWYIRNFVIDKKADAEMVIISSKALDSADPEKLKRTILAIANYTVWDKLNGIECPVLVLAASKDKFHKHDETLKIVTLLKNCNYIDLEDNKRSHSKEAGEIIRDFIESVTENITI